MTPERFLLVLLIALCWALVIVFAMWQSAPRRRD